MKVLVLGSEQIVEALRGLDHRPLTIAGEFDSPSRYFQHLRTSIAMTDCVLIESSVPTLDEVHAWACGYAEALGIQVLLISPWEGGVVAANPRSVSYKSLQEAVEGYFSTARAMGGKVARR